jgi:hypothetical protein
VLPSGTDTHELGSPSQSANAFYLNSFMALLGSNTTKSASGKSEIVVEEKTVDGEDASTSPPSEEALHDESPPTDRGRAAWQFMFCACLIEAILWGTKTPSTTLYSRLNHFSGFPLSFGAFQAYYSKQPEFRQSKYISVTGALAIVSHFGSLTSGLPS